MDDETRDLIKKLTEDSLRLHAILDAIREDYSVVMYALLRAQQDSDRMHQRLDDLLP